MLNIFLIKSRKMIFEEHAAHTGEVRNANFGWKI
jgi:hypothetical protein